MNHSVPTAGRSAIIDAIWDTATAPPSERPERWVAMPSVDDPRHILPRRLSTVLATSRRLSDDRATWQRWRDPVLVAGLLAVGGGRARRRFTTGAPSLFDDVAHELGLDNTRAIVMSGPPRANRKPVAQLHDHRGRTLAYVKVACNDLTARLLDDERRSLDHLAAVGTLGVRVPPVLGHGERGGVRWLAIGPVGVDHRRTPDERSIDALAVAIEATAPAWRGRGSDASYVARLRSSATGLPHAQPVVAGLVDRIGDIEIRTGGCHGDFVPWNMLSGDPLPAVWDWERYTTDAPAGFDRLHHRIQVAVHRRGASVPDAVAAVVNGLDRILADVDEPSRDAHLDWYLAGMLCRYESDAAEVATPQLRSLVTGLTTTLKERAR